MGTSFRLQLFICHSCEIDKLHTNTLIRVARFVCMYEKRDLRMHISVPCFCFLFASSFVLVIGLETKSGLFSEREKCVQCMNLVQMTVHKVHGFLLVYAWFVVIVIGKSTDVAIEENWFYVGHEFECLLSLTPPPNL